MIDVLILVVASILSLFVGTSVFLKNPKKLTYIIFLLLSVTLVVWSVVNYYLVRSSSDSLSRSLMTINFITVTLQNTLFFVFTGYFPSKLIKHKKILFSYFALTILTLLLLLTGNVIAGFEEGALVPAPGISIFMLQALISVVGGFKHLYQSKKTTSSLNQMNYLIYGSLVLWVVVPVTNFLLPLILDITFFARLSSLYVLLFTILIAYSILKHKLFDLKLVIARATGYIFITIIVIVMYVAAAYFLNIVLTNNDEISYSRLTTDIFLTVILVILYPALKKAFDKFTSSIFFRDEYNPQELIDRLNKTLVTNVDLDELLTKCALIIQEEMKASFCTFFIRETSYFDSRIIGAHRRIPEFESINEIQDLLLKTHSKIYASENDSLLESDVKLSKLLRNNEIDVLARLTNTLDYEVKGIGYIFLGVKKSGSQYSLQDLKILEIIANELVIAIENVLRFEEIEQFNVTLQNKIDEATRELKQTNDKLRALDEAKDEFVSMASHQLRTPLTSIKGYLSMVLDGDAGKITDQQKTMLGQAFFSSQRMVYLISDLLNVSRLKTGKFVIETKPVYLPDVVESELNQLYEGANAKNLKLLFTKPKKFATMNLDEMKLRQVIMNFTDNAIYYTPSGGKITVELKETPKSVEFTVKDTGIGVPKEQQHKLFAKFYRADNARKARPDGTGLGLFMAKKVIIAQGGSMIFDSKENKGSTFGFSFPKDKLEVKETSDK
jgi:signal transduction histidine kinase